MLKWSVTYITCACGFPEMADRPMTTDLSSTRVPSHLHGPQQSLGLVHRLLKLAGRIRIGHDSRSCLQIGVLALHEQRAYTNAGIQIAGKIGVQHRSAIDSAARRLQ